MEATEPISSAEQQSITITTTPPVSESISPQQVVCYAASLGWAIAELLGRCYMLKDAAPGRFDWSGAQLVVPQESYTPREKIRALAVYIRFLADSLGLGSDIIESTAGSDNPRRYVDVLDEEVRLFCEDETDPSVNLSHEQLRGRINEDLFFWDLHIHDVLQGRATAVPKAYIVGRTLASFRWYFGLRTQKMDDDFLKIVYQEYIQIMQPYVSQYAPGALANSLKAWQQLAAGQQIEPGSNGEVPIELQKQADIWFSLLTNERSALSYVPPSQVKENRRFTLKVLQIYWPFFVGGVIVLLVVLALLIFVIVSHFDMVTKGIAAAAGFIATLGIAHTLTTNVGDFVKKAATEVTKGSVINSIRDSSLQQAVNKSTCILPAGTDQQGSTHVA